MNKAENKLLSFITKNINIIYIVIAIIVSMLLRATMYSFISSDMEGFLIGWYGQIEQLGGLKGLSVQVGNYSVAYQTYIALLTELSVSPVFGYKILSCVMDYVLAIAVYFIIRSEETDTRHIKALLGAVLVMFSPVVCINSAMWGQCDSIYTGFILLSFLMYSKKKYPLCFVFFGLAFAFKLQAIFALPFLLFVYLYEKKFSILNFLITPATMIFVCIPAYINGRNFKGFISPYYYQTESCDKMYFNYPSFWSMIPYAEEYRAEIIAALKLPAIILTFLILLTIMFLVIKKNIELTANKKLLLLAIMMFTCVEFLPGMHERYAYGVEILSIVIAVKNKKTIPMAVALNLLTMITYGCGLFDASVNMLPLGVINLLAYIAYLVVFFKNEDKA